MSRRPLPTRAAERVRLPARAAERVRRFRSNYNTFAENWAIRWDEYSEETSSIPQGVPIQIATLAPRRPEDDAQGAFYWQAVLLDDRTTILNMQMEKNWQVGAMVEPLVSHIWLRLPRKNGDDGEADSHGAV